MFLFLPSVRANFDQCCTELDHDYMIFQLKIRMRNSAPIGVKFPGIFILLWRFLNLELLYDCATLTALLRLPWHDLWRSLAQLDGMDNAENIVLPGGQEQGHGDLFQGVDEADGDRCPHAPASIVPAK